MIIPPFMLLSGSLQVATTKLQRTGSMTPILSTSALYPSSLIQKSLDFTRTPTSQRTTKKHSYSLTASYSLCLVSPGAAENLPSRLSTNSRQIFYPNSPRIMTWKRSWSSILLCMKNQ